MVEQPNFIYQSNRVNLVRDFLQCTNCKLVFVPSRFHPSVAQQKDRYLEHNNHPTETRYIEFISTLMAVYYKHLRAN